MMAMVFVIVIFTVLTGVLGYAFAANRAVEPYERDQALHYAADAALEIGVQMVRDNPNLGTTAAASAPCVSSLPLGGSTTSPSSGNEHDPGEVFAGAARLNIECEVTPGVTSSGAQGPGGQQPRDVTITVVCGLPGNFDWSDPLPCFTPNAQRLVLARARVRFDVDPGWHTPAARARVPKVVSWEIER